MAHELNTNIGRRLRQKRILLGISQAEMGKKLGITFQQIQKYEKGTNRISAAALFRVCSDNGIDINELFEEVISDSSENPRAQVRTKHGGHLASFVNNFQKIQDQNIRNHLSGLIGSIAKLKMKSNTEEVG